ncbi:polysaccharide deacetylase family protein [Penicillium hispanicum]|uniref:polysaccharide deacetylase family protein n=1 Tax=Penicillium hispanicum TaxID=1080232 RepID=UPI002541F31B|nr:polysaccharide deacetylase family protein [Penicillium hispanicum]KAJ5586925.1 polysaccharide deacetylase family protein [Penicillium hispanicum]
MGILPARKAVALLAKQGQELTVVNTYGKQVVDFWAFNPNDPHDFLSMVHTRTILHKIALSKGDQLYSTRRKPILTLTEDTTRGVHDMIWSACDAERYHMQGYDGYHDNCTDNMHTALKANFPDFQIANDWVPDPLNIFMNVAIDHHGGLDIRTPTSEKGQYVRFRAKTDLIIVMSACPQDLAAVNGGMPTDCEFQLSGTSTPSPTTLTSIQPRLRPRKVKVALSVDFDAVSHWLGTGCHPDNNMADYSSGIFAGQVGAYRLLDLFKKHNVADKVTWFIPGHTVETFPEAARAVLKSGAEIGLHGYAHEGIYQMTEEQETDVLLKCIDVATKLAGKKPRGYRAPMYTIRETTVKLLREHGFLYDSSLMHHDSQPYFTPSDPPVKPIDFSQSASSWLHPTEIASQSYPHGQHPLVELPCGWYNEDMMPLQYLPHLANSMGYVSTRVVEQMWKDKFMWLWEHGNEGNDAADFIFPLLVHPDTSGLAHIIGMVDRILQWLQGLGGEVQFCTYEQIAADWLEVQKKAAGQV